MLVPTEDQEQRTLANWLDLHGVLWAHVPNGGARNRITGAILKGLGVKAGVPDVLIFDPPPVFADENRGTAIELKRRVGGRVAPEQAAWLDKLRERGWFVAVCQGAGEAIELLERLGYGHQRRASVL